MTIRERFGRCEGLEGRLPRRRQQRLRVADGRVRQARDGASSPRRLPATGPTRRSCASPGKRAERSSSSTIRAPRSKAPMSSTRTCGRRWDRRTSASSGCATSPVSGSTRNWSSSAGDGRDRPALPARALRRGDHGGGPLRAAVGRVGRGREPPARAEGADGSRDSVRLPRHAAAEGQRSDADVSSRHGRDHRRERDRLVLGVHGHVASRPTSSTTATTRARSSGRASDSHCRRTSRGARTPSRSMFMHGGWEHIIFNMLFLWIFGNNVEDALGRVRFLLWYLAGGLAATACADVRDAALGLGAGREHPEHRRERRDRRRARGLLRAAAERPRPDRDLRHPDLLPGDAGGLLPRLLVPVPALAGRLLDRAAGGGRRRGLLRPHRRLRVRGADRASRRQVRRPLQPQY